MIKSRVLARSWDTPRIHGAIKLMLENCTISKNRDRTLGAKNSGPLSTKKTWLGVVSTSKKDSFSSRRTVPSSMRRIRTSRSQKQGYFHQFACSRTRTKSSLTLDKRSLCLTCMDTGRGRALSRSSTSAPFLLTSRSSMTLSSLIWCITLMWRLSRLAKMKRNRR